MLPELSVEILREPESLRRGSDLLAADARAYSPGQRRGDAARVSRRRGPTSDSRWARVAHIVRVAWRHPHWALVEAIARCRVPLAPREGVRFARIGDLIYRFDFALDPVVRRIYARAYQTDIVALLRRLLRSGDTFVDVGANLGYLSCIAADAVGRSGRILSYEPVPWLYAYLREIVAMNPGYTWEVFPLGIGAGDGVAEITLSKKNIGWNSLVPDQIAGENVAGRVRVPVASLDRHLGEAGVSHVRVVKIDAEGYEGPIFQGMRRLLAERRIEHVIAEINPAEWKRLGIALDEFLAWMAVVGYRAHEVRPPYRPAAIEPGVGVPDVWFRPADWR